MRPRNFADFPDFSAAEEPHVQLAVAPADLPRETPAPARVDDREALVAELDRLRARVETLEIGPTLAGHLDAEHARDALAAIATIRWAVEDGSARLATALELERLPRARRRIAG